MSQLPDDDSKFTNFLRRHQPQPPPASADLEERILATIKQDRVTQMARSRRRSLYWVPATIAASLVAGLLTYRNLMPPAPNPNDVSSLETFIETNWNGTFAADDSSDISPLLDAVNSTQEAG